MIALVRAELLRFRSRRLVKALALLAILGIATVATVIAIQSRPEDDDAFGLLDVRNFVEGTSFLFAIAGWLLGASLAGAEWQAGTMTTLLTWEPRRWRVIAAKLAAAAVGVFLLTLALEIVAELVLSLVAATRGSTAGAGPNFARSLAALAVRVAVVTTVGAILGLALAMIARNTAAAIGIAFVYLAIVETFLRGFRPGWRPWLLGDNATAVVLGGGSSVSGRSFAGALAVLAAYGAVFVAVAAASFRVRDVG